MWGDMVGLSKTVTLPVLLGLRLCLLTPLGVVFGVRGLVWLGVKGLLGVGEGGSDLSPVLPSPVELLWCSVYMLEGAEGCPVV